MKRLTDNSMPEAPIANKLPTEREYHGMTITDDYAWLKDPMYPEVEDENILSYLRAENEYFDAFMAPRSELKETLFSEIKGRIKEDDRAVPWDNGDYIYDWYFEKGAEYRIWTRKRGDDGESDIILDEADAAKDHEFYKLGTLEVSPDQSLLAWSVDTSGGERFTLKIKNLLSGEIYPDEIKEISGTIVWSSDNKGFFYTRVSAEWRPYKVLYHRLDQDPKNDTVIYEEQDTSFFVGISQSSSDEYLLIRSADHVTAEVYSVLLTDPLQDPALIAARKSNRDLYVDHGQDQFFIRVNDTHKNFRIVTAPTNDPGQENWQTLKAGSDNHYYRGFQLFKDFIVIEDRVEGLDQIVIRADDQEHTVTWPEDVYACGLGNNPMYDQEHVRLSYESMISPLSVYDYEPLTKTLSLRKTQEIPTGYDKNKYETKRLQIKARDGTFVPISLVEKKGGLASNNRLHLYGYGAYGLGMDPSFSAARISLLDRGFTYAIAHIRGGDELGYGWYEAGKLMQRTNCFNDFVDCASALIDAGYAKAGKISISGGSAGGELMGAALNMAPELFAASVLHVPFVDVLNTMLDDTLPLTPIEWPEWGNPIVDAEAFSYIQSYSPYDQIEAKAYPPMMVTGGLNDPRVTYWEPAKWTAKMRATKTDENLLIMKINMGAGHAGKSGRFQRIEEIAEEYVFLLAAHEVTEDA